MVQVDALETLRETASKPTEWLGAKVLEVPPLTDASGDDIDTTVEARSRGCVDEVVT